VINLITFIGFCTVNAIVGGQALSAVSSPFPDESSLSTSAGISIIAVASLGIGFCGYKVLHIFERWAWIPVTIAFIIFTGVGGKHLGDWPAPIPGPASAGRVLSFAAIIAGFSISWSGCSSDFNTYMRRDIKSWKVFASVFTGLYLATALIQMLGAAFALAAISGITPSWGDAYDEGSIGGLVGQVLSGPGGVGGFGKFLLVIIAFGMISNNAPTVYAFCMSLQVLIPQLVAIPRFVFAIFATAIYLPLAIVGASHFVTALENFLGLLGYWYSIFGAIVLTEHLVYRRRIFENYDLAYWASPRKLTPGLAALTASAIGVGMAVLSMDQVWWRGPIARAISKGEDYGGDIGFELGFAVGGLSYLILRYFEKQYFGR